MDLLNKDTDLSTGSAKISEENTESSSIKFVPKGTGFLSKHKTSLISSILILVSVLLVLLIAYPTYNNYVSAKEDLEVKKKKLAELDLRVSQLKKVERLVATIERNTDLSNQAIPNDDEIPVVMAMVQKLAVDSGVSVSSFSYAGLTSSTNPTASVSSNDTANAATPSLDAFRLNISVDGKYDNIVKFLENIETSRRLLNVSNFSFSIERATTEVLGTNYTLKILITSYFKSFEPVASEINLEKYSDLVQVLERLKFTEVDLNDTNVGKIDPFSSGGDSNQDQEAGANGDTDVEVNPVEFESSPGFTNSNNSTGNTTTQQDAPSNSVNTNTDEDVEAAEGDVTKILQELLKQEGVN